MPNLYTRATALHDVCGRLDYISSDRRQENLLAVYDGAADLIDGHYWRQLAIESQAAFDQFGQKERTVIDRNTGEVKIQEMKCCQGRELVLQISNSLQERLKDDEILKIAVDHVSRAIGQPVAGALHYNTKKNNLHLHLVFAERKLLREPVIKVAERNLFFDANGKRVYKKAEILDENKQLLPGCRIVKKGEIYENRCFGAVDAKYSSKAWMKDLKSNTILALLNGELHGDVQINEFDPSTGKLPQQHIGKADKAKNQETASRIRAYNQLVKRWNWLIDNGYIDHERAMATQQAVMASRKRNEDLQIAVDEIEEAILRAEAERRQRRLERENWRRYQELRDESWQTYRKAQSIRMAAIRDCRFQQRELLAECSRPIYRNGQIVGCRMINPDRYFREKEGIEKQLQQQQKELRAIRNCEAVAKGRQRVVRSLIMAGADQTVIDSALREYEEASRLLQNYAQDPGSDFEGRRLKAAQDSLRRAEERASRYIEKLSAEQLDAPEDCQIQEQADSEYAAFKAADGKAAAYLAQEEAAAMGRKLSLADQLAGADSRQQSAIPGNETERAKREPGR